jgi:WD40 repeat protein
MEFDFENVLPSNSGVINETESARRHISYRFSVGDTTDEQYTCRFDPADRFIAIAGRLGIIRIYHLLTGKIISELHDPQGVSLETTADGHHTYMPITSVRWRPLSAQCKTGNVLISLHADGAVIHWHTTSGKALHRMYDPAN